MKKLLHVLTLVLTLTLILGFAGCSGNEEENYSKGLAFELNSDGTSYSVSGMGTCTDSEIIIPSTYNKLPVTAIGSIAFSGCSSVTSVEIPEVVTSIGRSSFSYCSSLTSIEFNGTMSQWQAISKGNDWKYKVPSTCIVKCSDGTLDIWR